MPKYEFLYFVRVLKTKTITAKSPELACDKFMKLNKVDTDNLSIDYELKDVDSGDMINISRVPSVSYFI